MRSGSGKRMNGGMVGGAGLRGSMSLSDLKSVPQSQAALSFLPPPLPPPHTAIPALVPAADLQQETMLTVEMLIPNQMLKPPSVQTVLLCFATCSLD